MTVMYRNYMRKDGERLDNFFVLVENINTYIFGPIGFIISVVTLMISWRINKKVNASLDIQEMKDDQENLSQRLDDFIELVNNKNLKKEEASQLRGLIYRIDSKYPFFSQRHKNKKVIENILSCINEDSLNSNEMQKNLIALHTQIGKAVR